jgi:glycosyltransferase involved in cell wall biosynthesis
MSARTPLVSILVPAYNAARFLPGLCQSIQAQTYPHYEVLIGDDGSTDNTASVVAPFLKDNRFQLLGWQENKGTNAGLMILCSSMRGDYWCGTGADDLFYPSFLEKRVEMMESNPNAFMVHGLPDLINEAGGLTQTGPRLLPDLPRELSAPRCLEVLLQHDVINAPSALARTTVTKQILPFFHWDCLFAQDWFLYILHAATGFDLLWDPRVLSKYRVHASSLSRTPAKDHLRRAEVRLVPLVALRTAAQFSHWAALAWSRWGRTLYWRWLRQAIALKSKGGLKDEWMQVAAHAYYGARGRRVSLWVELARHSVGLVVADIKHRRAQKRQSFIVSGLAEIDDPIFR